MNSHWKEWCWSWSSNILATWCKELTYWKRPWLVKIECRGRRVWQRIRWLDGITNLMEMSLSNLKGIAKEREVWCATFMGSQEIGHNLAAKQQHLHWRMQSLEIYSQSKTLCWSLCPLYYPNFQIRVIPFKDINFILAKKMRYSFSISCSLRSMMFFQEGLNKMLEERMNWKNELHKWGINSSN